MSPEEVPAGLRDGERWVVWSEEERDGKLTKVPRQPENPDRRADVPNEPRHRSDLETALAAVDEREDLEGVGFVFDADDLVVGVDLDDCRDPDSGELEPWAERVVETLDSFTEVSPSGTGLHVYALGAKPGDRCRSGGVEIYDNDRFFTVTGDHLEGTPEAVETRPEAIKAVYREYLEDEPEQAAEPEPPGDVELEDAELLEKARNAENGDRFERLWSGDTSMHDGDQSRADMALLCHLAFWTGGDRARMERLFEQSGLVRDKWHDRPDYRELTIDAALGRTTEFYDPKGPQSEATTDGGTAGAYGGPEDSAADGLGEEELIAIFTEACKRRRLAPGKVKKVKAGEGEVNYFGVSDILSSDDYTIGDAVMLFNREANNLDGVDRQAVIGRVVALDLENHGEFFLTPSGELYYFYEPETAVYRVDGTGRRELDEDFQAMVWERYNLSAGKFSRNLGKDIKSQARRGAPTKEVYRFAHFEAEAGELYVSDWESGYYAVSPEAIEWRPNGTDAYFLEDVFASKYVYLDPEDRPELPETLPGELAPGGKDELMRVFGNRVNFSEDAALGPLDQRNQLYIHLHTLPFSDELIGRPIMAWVGEKGSGKTVVQRSIGQFIFGPEYRESTMPDQRDDFLAKVANQPLAFVDNYDQEESWANDVLAAIATGTGIDKRELFTTNELRREVPRCWLSITSRNPPFRRDDVADRTLVFRVERVEDGFIGMGDYLREVTRRRDLLWSVYLENLQRVVAEYLERDTGSMSSQHRMAGWAIFAKIVADALGIEDVDELLELMETERATFALEDEAWPGELGRWVNDHPEQAGTWRKASDLLEQLEDAGIDAFGSSSSLGSKLSEYETELATLYDLEIDDQGRDPNRYRFGDAGGWF